VVTICTTTFNIQESHVLTTNSISVFCVDLKTNSDYFLYSFNLLVFITEMGCLLRGTDCRIPFTLGLEGAKNTVFSILTGNLCFYVVSSKTAVTVNILCAMFYHAESTRPIISQVNKLLKTKLKACSTLILCKED